MEKTRKQQPKLTLSKNQKFMLKQIRNSVKIINAFPDDRELSYTSLQNSLLSLVLLPYESAKTNDGKRIWQGSYSDICKNIGFTELTFKPIKKCEKETVSFSNKDQYVFIKKFRNAIAHQNINLVPDNQKNESIEFFNVYMTKCRACNNKECEARILNRKDGGLEDFRVSFTYNQLRDFALYVAESYTRSIKGETKARKGKKK